MGDEGRRFIRYVIPGLVYGVETLLFLLIALPRDTLSVASSLNGNSNALGTVAGSVLLFAGLGYIFSAFHHMYQQTCGEDTFNHLPIIKKLQGKDLIRPYVNLSEDELILLKCENEKARRKAQSISMALWYDRMKPKEHASVALADLGNQVHGLGTARVASIFAMVTVICILFSHEGMKCDVHVVIFFIVSAFAIWMFHFAYKRVASYTQEIYELTLEHRCAQKENNPRGASNDS